MRGSSSNTSWTTSSASISSPRTLMATPSAPSRYRPYSSPAEPGCPCAAESSTAAPAEPARRARPSAAGPATGARPRGGVLPAAARWAPAPILEEAEAGYDTTARDALVVEAALGEDRPDVLLDRARREDQLGGDRRVAPALRHEGKDLLLPGREGADGRRPGRGSGGDERIDDAGIDGGSTGGDELDGRDQLTALVDALFQEVGAALATVREELTAVGGIVLLREHDDAGPGMLLAEALGDANRLAIAGRRHAQVGDHHPGPVPLDGLPQLDAVAAHSE